MRPRQIKPSSIDRGKYYIVDSFNLHNPKLLWNEFASEEIADEAITHYLDNRKVRYSSCKGSKARIHGLKFYPNMRMLRAKDKFKRIFWIEVTKYRIPPGLTELHKRKHFRRLQRRKLKKLEKG